MWVIFEGLDKAGKTTLEWEFLKATNFEHVIIDRGPAGYLVFDKVFGRGTIERSRKFLKQCHKIDEDNDFIVVYCYCDSNTAAKRLKEHNEECPYDYEAAQSLYELCVRCFYNEDRTLMLDTSNKLIYECVELIIEKLMEVQKGEL